MATLSDIAIGFNAAQNAFASASAAKDKLERDKQQGDLDFKIKELQFKKLEGETDPDFLDFTRNQAKLENKFLSAKIDEKISGAEKNKQEAALLGQEVARAGGEFVRQSRLGFTPEQQQQAGEFIGRAQQDMRKTRRSTSLRVGPLTRTETEIVPKDIFATLQSKEDFRKAGRRQALLDTGKDVQDLTEEDIRAGILKREGQLGIPQGAFFKAVQESGLQFGAQQQLGSAEPAPTQQRKVGDIVDTPSGKVRIIGIAPDGKFEIERA